MADTPPPSSSPQPCTNGCGYFGSAQWRNMCSSCWREHIRAHPELQDGGSPQASSAAAPKSGSGDSAAFTTPVMRPVAAPPAPQADALPSAAAASPAEPAPRKVQKNTSRCWTCRKKIGLTGFKCHCGYFFCSEHRYSDKHDCDFDYQASARAQLEKANPLVVASKLDKI